MSEPIELSAEDVAEHLRWRLSNSNTEIDLPGGAFLDVAFDADRDEATVTLSVSSWNAETRQRGDQVFTFTVIPANDK
jgi:hypothetical protein